MDIDKFSNMNIFASLSPSALDLNNTQTINTNFQNISIKKQITFFICNLFHFLVKSAFQKRVNQTCIILTYISKVGNYSRGLRDIGMMVRVFTNGSGDLGSIVGRVIPKTQKMILDAFWFNTQHYKVRIKDKVEQSRERSSALSYTLV